MALVAWPDPDANSYSSRADAQTYFDDRLGSDAWEDATDNEKDQSLVTATRMIDRVPFEGEKTSDSQPLEWPRTGATDKDGNELPDDELPEVLLEAVYELALALLEQPTLASSVSTGSNIKRLKAGSAEIEYFKATTGTTFPLVVQKLLLPLMGAGASARSTPPVYSEDDGYDDCDDEYGVTGP